MSKSTDQFFQFLADSGYHSIAEAFKSALKIAEDLRQKESLGVALTENEEDFLRLMERFPADVERLNV